MIYNVHVYTDTEKYVVRICIWSIDYTIQYVQSRIMNLILINIYKRVQKVKNQIT